MSDDESAPNPPDGSRGATADGPESPQVEDPDDRTEAETETPPEPDPTPQSEALRRQQLYIGSGIALLAGLAVVVAGNQQFPGLPFVVYLLFGLAVTTLLFGFLVANMFRKAGE